MATRSRTPATTATGAPRTRRSTAEVRLLLLDAARECFEEKGYHQTSTREIAEHAGVTEPMLFRHFGSKALLFERAVFDPFVDFIATFAKQVSEVDAVAAPKREMARQYIEGFFRLMVDNRDLILTVLAERTEDGQAPLAARAALEGAFDAFAGVVEAFVAGEGEQIMDTRLALRFTLSFLLGAALADGYFFTFADSGADDGTLVEEMVDFVMRSIGHSTI